MTSREGYGHILTIPFVVKNYKFLLLLLLYFYFALKGFFINMHTKDKYIEQLNTNLSEKTLNVSVGVNLVLFSSKISTVAIQTILGTAMV